MSYRYSVSSEAPLIGARQLSTTNFPISLQNWGWASILQESFVEAEPGAVLLQVVGVNGRHPLTQSLVSKIGSKRWTRNGRLESL